MGGKTKKTGAVLTPSDKGKKKTQSRLTEGDPPHTLPILVVSHVQILTWGGAKNDGCGNSRNRVETNRSKKWHDFPAG